MILNDPGDGGEAVDIDPDVDVEGGDDQADDDGGDQDPDAFDQEDDLTDEEEAEYQAKMSELRKAQEDPSTVKKKTKDKDSATDNSKKEAGKGQQEEENSQESEEKPAQGEERHTIKVNGEEKELTTKELIVLAQKAEASEQRFQEGASSKKQVQAVMDMAKNDTMKFLDKLGVDPEKVEQWLYDNHIAPSILQGEEKEQWERNKEFERLKEKDSEREEKDKKDRQEQTRQAWSNKIIGAIKSSPNIPQTDWSVNRVAQYMQRAIKGGFRDVTPEEVIPYVEKDWNKIKSSQMDSLDEDQMLDYLGEAGTEKVRKALLKKHKAGQRKPRSQRAAPKAADKRGTRKKHPRSPYDLI